MQLKSLLTVALALTLVTTVFAGGVAAQDGGDAVAIQANDQSNANSQTGIAIASNYAEDIEQENEIDFGDNGPPPTTGDGFPGSETINYTAKRNHFSAKQAQRQ